MKKITLLLLFSVFINAQDVLTTVSGKKYKGKLKNGGPKKMWNVWNSCKWTTQAWLLGTSGK